MPDQSTPPHAPTSSATPRHANWGIGDQEDCRGVSWAIFATRMRDACVRSGGTATMLLPISAVDVSE